MAELKRRTTKVKARSEAGTDDTSKEVSKELIQPTSTDSTDDVREPPVPLRYGPMPTFSRQRLWSRSALILGLMTIVYYNSGVKESSFAKFEDNIPGKAFETKCSSGIEAVANKFEGCKISKCGRMITDNLVDIHDIFGSSDLAKRVFSVSQSESAIYDLHTGKLLHDRESDLIVFNSTGKKIIFRVGDKQYIQALESKVRRLIVDHFHLDFWKVRLSTAFFTHITPTGKRKHHLAKLIVHQESFATQFSAIIYLTDFGTDFTGGRLIFPDSDSTNRTVEGRKGRVLVFTSGLENQHVTEPVTSGKLITLVAGFACDEAKQTGNIKLT